MSKKKVKKPLTDKKALAKVLGLDKNSKVTKVTPIRVRVEIATYWPHGAYPEQTMQSKWSQVVELPGG